MSADMALFFALGVRIEAASPIETITGDAAPYEYAELTPWCVSLDYGDDEQSGAMLGSPDPEVARQVQEVTGKVVPPNLVRILRFDEQSVCNEMA
eukprot:7137818-Prymnesium_polylepis.1